MNRNHQPHIEVSRLTMGYGDTILMHDLNFRVDQGDVFAVMGGSGCGKSTLLRILIGIKTPHAGTVRFNGTDLWSLEGRERTSLMQRFGVLYQNGALWSAMTLVQNVALPLQLHTDLDHRDILEIASFKLSLVGLAGFEDYFPSDISGGMRKRAGLARAIALDPDILFFDEPSAGLDPVSAKHLDELILELNRSLNATVILVTHELPSIFALANNSIFLDTATRTMGGRGDPKKMLSTSENPNVIQFLTRGGETTARQPGT
jgi:phospholipid/cholesterol/gamma-HCH transport system ATP-binding protein